MAMKYTNIFHSKAPQNIPKIGTFCMKIYHLATLDTTLAFWHKNSPCLLFQTNGCSMAQAGLPDGLFSN
jgi:hypothetical protein